MRFDAYCSFTCNKDIRSGLITTITMAGVGNLKPNIVILSWPKEKMGDHANDVIGNLKFSFS